MHINQRFYSTRRLIVILGAFVVAAAAFAQGTEPRKNAAVYPVHGKVGGIAIGAEYMVHSFGANQSDQMLLAEDFLVVEIAIYSETQSKFDVDSRKFSLRLNGRKEALFAESPGMVAASIKYPDWQRKPQLTAGGGVGDTGITVGQPPSVARFPGDRRADRLPPPPQAGTIDRPAPDTPVDSAQILEKVALPEGPSKRPVSGYVFFPYRGKLKSLKSVELIVSLESEPLLLRLK